MSRTPKYRFLDEAYTVASIDLDLVIAQLDAMASGATAFPAALRDDLSRALRAVRRLRSRLLLHQVAGPEEPPRRPDQA